MTVPDSCFSPPRVAILIEQNFENFTFKVPYTAFQQMGAKVLVFCDRLPKKYQRKQKKVSFQPTNQLTEAKPEDFDVVILPSGIEGKGLHSRINTIHFVDRALKFGKIVAAISQGVQVLIEGDLVKYRNVAGFSTIEKDIIKAGGNYLDEPLVIDGNLFTSRQPSDLPIFMTAILSRLKLPLPDQASPNSPSRYPEWWQLAEVWGGSSKDEIINKLNTALVGEFYTQKTFEQYLEKACNSEVRSLFKEIISTKKQHIEKLQYRLHQLGQNCSLPTGIADNLAQFDTAFIGQEDTSLLNYALNDLQAGVIEAHSLKMQQTDANSTAIFTEIEQNLTHCEQCLGTLYRDRLYLQGISLKKTTPLSVFSDFSC